MPYKEKPITKKYFEIGEVADMIHKETYTIRYWETFEFPWIKPRKRHKTARRYTHKEVAEVMTIAILKYVGGMTKEGIQQAHAMGYMDELKMLYINRTRNFRPEASSVFQQYPMNMYNARQVNYA